MSDPMLDPPPVHMAEDEFLALGDSNDRRELVDGTLRVSAINNAHTRICLILWSALMPAAQLAGYEVLVPASIRIRRDLYLTPDLAVGRFARDTRINPPSDAVLVVEVASPSTASFDRKEKKRYYAEAGIGWYLIVEPDFAGYGSAALSLFRLDGDRYAEHAVAPPGETLTTDDPIQLKLNTTDLVTFWPGVR